jgi:hypothetical protein
VQGKHPKFGAEAVSGCSSLPSGDTQRDDDVTQLARLICRKRKDIRGGVLSPVAEIQLANVFVWHDGNGDCTSCARRCHGLEPVGKPRRTHPRRDDDVD